MISKVQQESCLAHRKHAADIGYYSILKWRDLLTSPPCMHTCTYIHTCIHMHALADTHTYTYTHVHMHMHIHLPLTTSHSHENNQTNGLFLSALAGILNTTDSHFRPNSVSISPGSIPNSSIFNIPLSFLWI